MSRLNIDDHVRCRTHALCYVTICYQQQNQGGMFTEREGDLKHIEVYNCTHLMEN